jgi:hypothetical protein
MGYRLVPTRVQHPMAITNGAPFDVQFEWVNRGVGRALRDYQIRFVLMDSKGSMIAKSAPDTLRTSQWLPGAGCSASHAVKFKVVLPGEYELAFALSDPATGRAIALPVVGMGAEQRCPIGRVMLQ